MTTLSVSANKLTAISLLVGGIIVAVLAYVLISAKQLTLNATGAKAGQIGGNFTLTSAAGPVSLSDYENKVVVVYFGFASCKMVCPTSMKTISDSFKQLSAANMAQVQAILITTDPDRDTPQSLAQFTRSYHTNIVGLSGSKAELQKVSQQFAAPVEVTTASGTDEDYGFYHSSRYYVIDKNGILRDAMRHSTTANELSARIRTLL